MGIFHAKRLEYVSLNVNVQGLTCDLLDQPAKQEKVDIGVAEDATGTRFQRRGERAMTPLCFIGPVQSPRIFQIDIPRFA